MTQTTHQISRRLFMGAGGALATASGLSTPVAANVPVTCGKVEVHPGDLVAADSDGVIVVPKAVIDGLEASIMERSAHEKEMRRKIDEGESLEEAYSL